MQVTAVKMEHSQTQSKSFHFKEVEKMTKTLTANYETEEAARNAHEDLIGTGYPREKVFLQPDSTEVKVITPSDTAPQAREILGRHEPSEITENES